MTTIPFEILLADDDEVDFMAVKRICNKLNIKVDHAENGEIAYQKLQEKQYSMLITDIDMPSMDGLKLVKSIRSSNDEALVQLTVAAVSGTSDKNIVGNYKSLGFDYFFTKPVNPDGLKCIFENLKLI